MSEFKKKNKLFLVCSIIKKNKISLTIESNRY